MISITYHRAENISIKIKDHMFDLFLIDKKIILRKGILGKLYVVKTNWIIQ